MSPGFLPSWLPWERPLRTVTRVGGDLNHAVVSSDETVRTICPACKKEIEAAPAPAPCPACGAPAAARPRPKVSGLAVASFIIGLLSLIGLFFAAIGVIVLTNL